MQDVAFVQADSFAISPVTSLTQGLFCALFAFSGMRMHTHGCSWHVHMVSPDRALHRTMMPSDRCLSL